MRCVCDVMCACSLYGEGSLRKFLCMEVYCQGIGYFGPHFTTPLILLIGSDDYLAVGYWYLGQKIFSSVCTTSSHGHLIKFGMGLSRERGCNGRNHSRTLVGYSDTVLHATSKGPAFTPITHRFSIELITRIFNSYSFQHTSL